MRTKHPLARWSVKLLLATSLLFVLAPQTWSSSQAQGPEHTTKWRDLPPHIQAKVDPRILAELAGEIVPTHLENRAELAPLPKKATPPRDTRFLVYLKAQTDLESLPVPAQATSAERRATVVDALLSTARATQAPVKAVLDRGLGRGSVTGYTPFYVFNGFAVQGSLDTVIELAKREDTVRLSANYRLVRAGDESIDAPAQGIDTERQYLDAANWNIGLVGAEQVWDQLGVTGQGAVVASFDTGVDWDHPALRDQYRGVGVGPVDHDYNWFEFNTSLSQYWNTSGNYGSSASNAPYDCADHGTHTTGTMVGDGGTQGTQIGMAPGAKWIAVPGICGRTMPGGYQDDIGGIRTFQWLMCPTDLSGNLSTRDCSKAPDVINNSWGSSNPADNTFQPVIQALRAAGIVPVFASGNPSAGLGSIGSPASVPEAIAVGATDSSDQVTAFSGRGPSIYEDVQKPELSAPGGAILSSVPGTQYQIKSGTSMAAPHVSGLAALMVSADMQDGQRNLDVDQLLNAMTLTAIDLGPSGPDDEYGYGRINAFEAVNWVLSAGVAQITVRDINSGTPLPDSTITLTQTPGTQRYTAQTDASGSHAFPVPSGTYSAQIQAFGYAIRAVSNIVVSTGQQTIANTALTPLNSGTLVGQVHSRQVPIPGARLYVDSSPSYETYSATDGTYNFRLPVGTHGITIEAQGHRIAHSIVSVQGGNLEQGFDLSQAPTILLVEADGYKGWYEGRPARQFFQWALDSRDYVYDTVVITDTATLPQLGDYDLIIWSHTVGSPGIGGYGTNGVLQEYLDEGGRLILSGQNIGYWDQWQERDVAFFRNYLHSAFYMDDAAKEGDMVSGSQFLSGIHLPLNEAAQYGYPNTVATLSPDSIGPLDGSAYPILTYDNGNEAAALAIDLCDDPYRVVYLGVGYENLGPRATSRPPEYAEMLDRAIQWASKSKPSHDVSVSIAPVEQSGTPGTTLRYNLTVANTGFVPDTYDLGLSGNQWPTRLLNAPPEVISTDEIAPCDSVELVIEVDVPLLANPDDQDAFSIEAISRSEPSISDRVVGRTTVLSPWQTVAPMPTLRYRLAAASLPNSTYYYAIGGFGGANWDEAMDANERYDTYSDQWQPMTPMPTPRGNISAAAIGNGIYVAGGYAGESQLDVLEIYHVSSDSWSSGAVLPEPTSGAASAAWGGKLYLFGGTHPGGGLSNQTYVYDPSTDRWTEMSPMPGGARAFAAAATLDDKIYVAGGWYVDTVEVYDPVTDSWSQAASLNIARQSPGMAAAPDGRLYVGGGGDDWWSGFRTTERYDPAQDRWELLDSLSDGNRAGAAMAYVDGRVFCTGGIGDQLSQVHESLRLAHSICQPAKTLYPDNPEGTYAVTTDKGRANYAWISSTASLSGSLTSIQRGASTLPTPVDLSTSTKTADKPFAMSGERVTYDLCLNNAGQLLAEGATLTDPIPQHTTYVADSVICSSGTCSYAQQEDEIRWSGDIASGSVVILRFAVTLGSVDQDATPIVNKATLVEATSQEHNLQAVFVARTSDLSNSSKQATPIWVDYGETLTFTIQVHNSAQVDTIAVMRDRLPDELTFVPNSLWCASGTCTQIDGTISWQGTVRGQTSVPIQFRTRAPDATYPGSWLINRAIITDTNRDRGHPVVSQVRLGDAPEWMFYLPLVLRAP